MTDHEARHSTRACPQCHLGSMKAGIGVYTAVHSGMFLSAPGMRVWECDVCGFKEFDPTALSELNALVGQKTVTHDSARQNTKPTPKDVDDASDTASVVPFKR